MEDNTVFEDLKSSMDMSLTELHKVTKQFQDLLPKTVVKKVKVKNELANVYMTLHGAIMIKFDNEKFGKEFFDSLK